MHTRTHALKCFLITLFKKLTASAVVLREYMYICIKVVTNNTSSYRFIHGYMFRLLLRAVMMPVINVNTANITQCTILIFPLSTFIKG